MFDIFRFMVLRPPEDVDTSAMIPLDNDSTFFQALRDASHSQAPLAAMQQISESFVNSGLFVREPSSLVYFRQYQAVYDTLSQSANPTLRDLFVLIKKVFQTGTSDIIHDKGFLDDRARIQDSLVALQLAAAPQNTQLERLPQICRVINLIERVGREDPSLNLKGAIQQALNRLIILPADLFPVPGAPTPPPSSDPANTGAGNSQQGLISSAAALHQALLEINSLSVDAQPLPSPSIRAAAAIRTPGEAANTAPALLANTLKSPAPAGAAGLDLSALQALSPAARQVLNNLNLDIASTPLPVLAEHLNAQFTQTMNLLAGGSSVFKPIPFPIPLPQPDPFHEPPAPAEWSDGSPSPFPFPPSTPNPQVKPAGIADLLVVREHALRYEPGEIAFVENVARGESFERHTRRKNTTENSTLTTTFSSSETERDLQTTDRFGLQRQSQSAVQDQAGSVAGMGISNAYGPLVDSSGSLQQSTTQVSSYGQDVTRRAVSKLTQSLETQVFQRATTEFDESVEHEFNNSAGQNDQIVVYQWLDKIVQAKVFTYGKRILYDIVVPEPAAFLVYEMQKWQPELAALQKPTLFSLQARFLSDDPKNANYYHYWATGYGASGIQPPPEPQIVIAKTYGNVSKDPFGNQPPEARSVFEVAKEDVTIPDGYQAQSAVIDVEAEVWADVGMSLNVDIGQNYAQALDVSKTPLTLALKGEVSQIPLTVSVSGGPAIYTVEIEIICARTAQSMAQWQARTHDIILQASRDRLAEYEDRFNTLKAALTVKLAGKNADEKQALIRAELEKNCISILSNQHFEAFNAIEFVLPSGGVFPQDYTPQLYLPNVGPMGRYIRFFQQAFEWDQMLYLYYPYFWGRKKYWNDRVQLDDQDPDFATFLGAGAARVTVPVRPGYEQAVADFMNKGIVPTEADLLSGVVTTGLYVPFFAEMMGVQGGPDTAVPYGDPPVEWELRVPTTLVKVRTDNTLPKWASDTWEPVNPGDSENP